jgi:hypothetical protein
MKWRAAADRSREGRGGSEKGGRLAGLTRLRGGHFRPSVWLVGWLPGSASLRLSGWAPCSSASDKSTGGRCFASSIRFPLFFSPPFLIFFLFLDFTPPSHDKFIYRIVSLRFLTNNFYTFDQPLQHELYIFRIIIKYTFIIYNSHILKVDQICRNQWLNAERKHNQSINPRNEDIFNRCPKSDSIFKYKV